MNIEEKTERINICEGEGYIGCVSVRYPVLPEEYKVINSFYEDMASSYIRFAEKKIPRICKKNNIQNGVNCVLLCQTCFSDDFLISVRCEARLYINNEVVSKKVFSNVWDLQKRRIRYLRRHGKRKSNVGYNGREVYLFSE